MFEVYCPSHRSPVLLSIDRIDHVDHVTGSHDLVVHWHCWCGQPGRTTTRRRIDYQHLPQAS